MRKLLVALVFVVSVVPAVAQQTAEFDSSVNRWLKANRGKAYPRFAATQVREIADNIIAYQNADGGWAKNLDMMSCADPDSVIMSLTPRYRTSTLDNNNIYTQIAYLSETYRVTGDKRYRDAARKGVEWILAAQYPNGGWRGWDVDAITFNDNVMPGVLWLWLDILEGQPRYAWVDKKLRTRIRHSWDRGLDLLLRCQWVRDGVKTIWPQQCDHETLLPVKARAFELPGLVTNESTTVVMLLMRIENPSPEVIDAVKSAVAWFDRTKIEGKKIVTVSVPEGLPEDPNIKADRILVDDPDAAPIWARYYETDRDDIFFATRASVKVYSLKEVPAERRLGYAWYGVWGNWVLDKYPAWLAKIEKVK